MKSFTLFNEAVNNNQQNQVSTNIQLLIQAAQKDGYIGELSKYLDIKELFQFAQFFKLNAIGLSGGLKQDQLDERKTVFQYQVKTKDFNTFRSKIQSAIQNFTKNNQQQNNTQNNQEQNNGETK